MSRFLLLPAVLILLLGAWMWGTRPATAPEWRSITGPAADGPAAAGPTDGAPAIVGPVAPAFHEQAEALETRLAATPDDAETLLTLARLRLDAHRHDEALALFERAVVAAPAHRQAWLDLATAYAALGRWADAERASHALLALVPGDPSARYNLGAIAANRGDAEAAQHWWQGLAGTELGPQAAASLDRLSRLASHAEALSAASPSAEAARLPEGHPPLPHTRSSPLNRFLPARMTQL